MAAETFWSNRDKAQNLINEASTLRRKIEPLQDAEKRLDDFRVMIELGESEPPEAQPKAHQELERDLAKLNNDLDAIELRVLLSGPRDKNNCMSVSTQALAALNPATGPICFCVCTSAGVRVGAGK